MSATPLLDRVTTPADLKSLSDSEPSQVAHDLRSETISAVSETGGHLGAGLGVVVDAPELHVDELVQVGDVFIDSRKNWHNL